MFPKGRICTKFPALAETIEAEWSAENEILFFFCRMRRHEIVPYDYDSGVLSARFGRRHLVLGFGSFSNRRDGGIALFSMDEVLSTEDKEEKEEEEEKKEDEEDRELSVTRVPAPFYHWTGWDGHTGGVTSLHVDEFQLVAANSCVHQVRGLSGLLQREKPFKDGFLNCVKKLVKIERLGGAFKIL